MRLSSAYSLVFVSSIMLSGCDGCTPKDPVDGTVTTTEGDEVDVTVVDGETDPSETVTLGGDADTVVEEVEGGDAASDTPTELEMTTIKEGDGATAESGQTVSVHYVGTLTDGTKFDSSRDRGAPFEFKLGAGEVISGWDQGVQGMKVGEVRKLVIPPSLGYGSRGVSDVIPPDSTLEFEVELLEVK